ncbi:hypothetical protein GCM10025867_36810 [Frondihabitans sucicola]|uniref:CoA transferase n=1 Tax=Frondihabitans sucicola TaxID=1268041 RepID=A0ABM8GSJ5_9MICO|nr:CoA transferase [Frondihabitans sucicola]BDZ51440.1 hypothetical protein GCM10025867_36810 [Frondihabitans sucicola]
MSHTEPAEDAATKKPVFDGLRVIEIADVTAEYVGLQLAGLGAEVVKVEPPEGQATRRMAPHVADEEGPDSSLHFWHYNRGKKSVVLDLTTPSGRESLYGLLESADVLLQSVSRDSPDVLELSPEEVRARWPRLVHARVTPFGDDGPWSDHLGSDLVHLALGGVAMCCGYDPQPGLHYDLPPVVPQLLHAYHITGEQLLYGIEVALIHRLRSGDGQTISIAIHEAVSKSTEIDVMEWAMRRVEIHRQTCRHAAAAPDYRKTIAQTKDGRWVATFSVNPKDAEKTIDFAHKYGMATAPIPESPDEDMSATGRPIPGAFAANPKAIAGQDAARRMVEAFTYADLPWREAQAEGLMWVPLRRPHENAYDEHWQKRGTFDRVEHPELGRQLLYPVSKWRSSENPWRAGSRAPHLGQHTEQILSTPHTPAPSTVHTRPRLLDSPHAKPFALSDIRILDFAWFLASAGGTRILTSFGAETLKVEWYTHPDTRLGAMSPVGGRDARDRATGPLPPVTDPDKGGQFNNKNPGKLGLSLNVTHPEGLEIARELVRRSDVVTEGFSPGVLDKWGLGYDRLRELNDDIIYVQQSGMGSYGTYGRFRTVGPVAAAFAGMSEMSGLPEPFAPAGWGYSFLDWIGAYGYAQAILAALYHREVTGKGQHIDASQVEAGISLIGPTLLDWQVNGREFRRQGNVSPFASTAGPHALYPCRGDDRWIAISVFTQEEWERLAHVAGHGDWLDDARFTSPETRAANRAALDQLVGEWTAGYDAAELMATLQASDIRAGVAQNAEDRYDHDPQLKHLDWLTEVTGTKIGRWPVYESPVKMSATPPYAGGRTNRGAPGYGEDNEAILGESSGSRRPRSQN